MFYSELYLSLSIGIDKLVTRLKCNSRIKMCLRKVIFKQHLLMYRISNISFKKLHLSNFIIFREVEESVFFGSPSDIAEFFAWFVTESVVRV